MQLITVSFIFSLLLFVLPSSIWAADEVDKEASEEPVETQLTEKTEPALAPSDEANTTSLSDEEPIVADTTPVNEPVTPITYITPDKAKTRIDDVVRYLTAFQRENEVIEISGNDTTMAGLYLPENTGKPQGGVLILHDIDQHAQWPNTVTPIREYLPDYGWNTLSIFFDQYIKKPLPKVEPFSFDNAVPVDPELMTPLAETATPADNNPQSGDEAPPIGDNDVAASDAPESQPAQIDAITPPNANAEGDALDEVIAALDEVPQFESTVPQAVLEQPAIPIKESFIEDMVARTEQGLNKLNELGQFNVAIIANGYSANWAAKLLEKRLSGNKIGYALILIDAKANEYPAIDLNQTLATLGIPMLDIITNDAPEALRLSKARKGTILRNQNTQYMQLFLPAVKVSLNNHDNMISRRIRGWLLTHAAGEEVPVAVKNY